MRSSGYGPPIVGVVLCVSTFGGQKLSHESIMRDLKSKVPAVRRTAVKELVAQCRGTAADAAVVDALIAALHDDVPLVRRAAAKALGKLEDDRAAEALAEALQDDDQTVRYYAAHALGEIAASGAAKALVNALQDDAWCVRSEAAWALREIDDPHVVGLLEEALAQRSGPNLDSVVWIMRDSHTDQLLELLAGILRTGDTETRVAALQKLASLGGDQAFEAAVASLRADPTAVRAAAVSALLEIGDRRGVEPLRALAQQETDSRIKQAASEAALILSRHEDLVAHWRFDADQGNTAVDSGGRDIHGRIINCKRIEGKSGNALEFGKGSCVELGKPAEFPIAHRPFSVTAWVKSAKPDGVVVARGGAFCGFSLYIKDGVPKFGIHLTQDGKSHIVAGNENVTGRWVHLAGVVDEKVIRLYVDGKKVGDQETPGLIPGNCGQSMEIGFDIGNSAAEITDHFTGIIDEVKVFHTALSEHELVEFW